MACLDGEELSCAGTHAPEDIEADMIAVVNDLRPCSLDGPSPSGSRLSVDPCFIPEPELHLGIPDKTSQPIREFLPEFFILPVGPRLRYFQDVTLLVKKAKDGVVGTIEGIFLCDMSMERRSGPKGPLRTARLFELFKNLFLLSPRNQRCPSSPSLRDKPIGEGLDDLPYGALGQLDGLHHLLPGGADEQHDDDERPPIRFPVAGPPQGLKIGKGRILRIGSKVMLRHDSYQITCLSKCLGITTSNVN